MSQTSISIKMSAAIHLKTQRLIYLPASIKLSGGLNLLTNNLFLLCQSFQTTVFYLNKHLCLSLNSIHSVLGLIYRAIGLDLCSDVICNNHMHTLQGSKRSQYCCAFFVLILVRGYIRTFHRDVKQYYMAKTGLIYGVE